jgi:hypothetical protein
MSRWVIQAVASLGFQKLAGVDSESLGQLAKHCNRGAIDAALELADVAAIDFRSERELFLASALLSSEPPEVSANGVPQIMGNVNCRA